MTIDGRFRSSACSLHDSVCHESTDVSDRSTAAWHCSAPQRRNGRSRCSIFRRRSTTPVKSQSIEVLRMAKQLLRAIDIDRRSDRHRAGQGSDPGLSADSDPPSDTVLTSARMRGISKSWSTVFIPQHYKLAGQAFWLPVGICGAESLGSARPRIEEDHEELMGGPIRKEIPVYLSGSGRETEGRGRGRDLCPGSRGDRREGRQVQDRRPHEPQCRCVSRTDRHTPEARSQAVRATR